MPSITLNEVQKIYLLAKNVYFQESKKKDALIEAENFGMNKGSAHDLITNFKYMYEGKKFTRTNNNITTKYYLENIFKDFGIERLENAISALDMHIEYYENLRMTTMHGLRDISKVYKNLLFENSDNIIYPDEINEENLFEGLKKQISINAYERNSKARKKCIEYYGTKCVICNFDFEEVYGDIGHGFIHVHHLKPLSEINKEYNINPIEDLRPVCPNCHAMLHKKKPAYSINELRNRLQKLLN